MVTCRFLTLFQWSFLVGFLMVPVSGNAESKMVTYSLQVLALAPNAGGQNAYALRRATDEEEMFAFYNNYLGAGEYSLIGLGYDWRFPICDQSCFWQFYFEAGGGVSTAGPFAELLWGTNIFWVARLDISTHFYLTSKRVIGWSYPLWVGISMPL